MNTSLGHAPIRRSSGPVHQSVDITISSLFALQAESDDDLKGYTRSCRSAAAPVGQR